MTRFVATLVVALLATRVGIEAQQAQPSGAVRGSVEDVSGAVVAGATVTLVDQAGQTAIEVVTDSSGAFAFDKVLPGSYQVRTAFPGFDPVVRLVSVAGGRRTVVPTLVLQVPAREVSLQGGMYENKRVTAAFNAPINDKVAARVDGMFEDSESFRDFVGLKRYGVTPTVTVAPSDRTRITLRYEYLHDERTADRGITSFQGRPADVDIATFMETPL